MTQTDKEDKLVLSRAEDAIKLSERNYQIKTVGFLNPHQRSLILKSLHFGGDVRVSFEGGYPSAERTMMLCVPEYLEADTDEIISVVKITGRDIGSLTHRDYLGSLMGLGITRENIGDILCTECGAFVFVRCEIADYILNNLEKIGRNGVKLELCKCADTEIPEPKIREIKGTVSSLRLDAVLSLSTGLSRTRAAELISAGQISLNWEVCDSPSRKLCEGDLISARGLGRMRVESIGGLTRKGRIGLSVARFE